MVMRKAMPRTSANTPPTERNPCVGALRSAMNSTSASIIISAPAMLSGRLARETIASTAASPPITPGKISPGFDISVMMP